MVLLRMLEYILGSQGTHEGVVLKESYPLYYVSDSLRMQEMYNEIMCTMPNGFHRISVRLKTQEMCNKAVVDSWQLKNVSNRFKIQKMCDAAVCNKLSMMLFVPDWFLTQQQIDVWYDDYFLYNDNEMIKWYDVYKVQKAKKANIEEELLPTVWHPNCMMDWCMSEDQKGWWK